MFDGQIQCIVTLDTHFTGGGTGSSGCNLAIIWISTDYGSTWIQSPEQATYRNIGYEGEIFNAVTMDSTGAKISIAVGDKGISINFFLFHSIWNLKSITKKRRVIETKKSFKYDV